MFRTKKRMSQKLNFRLKVHNKINKFISSIDI